MDFSLQVKDGNCPTMNLFLDWRKAHGTGRKGFIKDGFPCALDLEPFF